MRSKRRPWPLLRLPVSAWRPPPGPCGLHRSNVQHENARESIIYSRLPGYFRFFLIGLWDTLDRGLYVRRVEVRGLFPLDAKIHHIRILSMLSVVSIHRSAAPEGPQGRAGAPHGALRGPCVRGRDRRGSLAGDRCGGATCTSGFAGCVRGSALDASGTQVRRRDHNVAPGRSLRLPVSAWRPSPSAIRCHQRGGMETRIPSRATTTSGKIAAASSPKRSSSVYRWLKWVSTSRFAPASRANSAA